jgi:hypothetical protein
MWLSCNRVAAGGLVFSPNLGEYSTLWKVVARESFQEVSMSERDPNSLLGLPEVAQSDLANMATHADKLSQIALAVKDARPGVELAPIVATTTGLSTDEAQRILWTIWNLYLLKRRLDSDSAKVIADVTKSLEKQTSEGWKQKHLQAWNNSVGEVVSLLDTITDEHPLAVNSKAAALGRAHQNLFTEARVITDVRPVFSAGGDRVLESLIVHTMLLDYFNGTKVRRIELALDAADVAQLRRLCERAERKAAVLKAALKDLPWATAVLGEEQSQ